MNQNSYSDIIVEQTERMLWEVENVIKCIPEKLWPKTYGGMPLWKHVYHMLHSLDLWFINPRDSTFMDPHIHEKDLNNLDVFSEKQITCSEIMHDLDQINQKITCYVHDLCDEKLLAYPKRCEYTRFTLILAQYRHLHTHMGMLMGFLIEDTGKWPKVTGLEGMMPQGNMPFFFE